MHKNVILRATLIVVIIVTLIAPATAQEPPPPHTPPSSAEITSSQSSLRVLDNEDSSNGKGIPTSIPSPIQMSATTTQRTEPTPQSIHHVQGDNEVVRKIIEKHLRRYAQINHSITPVLTEVIVDGDMAYGIVEGIGAEPVPVQMRRRSDGSWGDLAFDLTVVGLPDVIQKEVKSVALLAQPPTPPRFLTLPFDQQSGALPSSNIPQQGWWYNVIWQNGAWVSRPVSPDPENYQNADHKAVDYMRSDKQSFTVRAAADGEARRRSSTTWGTYVYIKHIVGGETWYTLYSHLDQCYVPNDGQGHQVSRGDSIGTAGVSGTANGIIHLHFEFSKEWIGGTNRVDSYGVYGSNNYYYPYPFTGQTQAWTTTPPSYPGSSSVCPAPTDGHPRDGETIVASDRRVTFSWTAPSCSGLDYYTFRVANHQDIDSGPWIIDHGVGSGETSVTEQIPSQYDNQTLYWAIWPHNSAGYGSRGGPWSFKVNPNQGSSDPVTIYSEANYQPQDHDNYGWHDPCTSPECGNLPNWLNTRASSIKIDPGWSVRVYEGDGQTDGQRCFNDSDNNFDDDTFDNGHSVNDHVRSVAVYHQEQCPSLPQPPPAPSLSTPGNGTSYPQSTSITLDWHPSSGATEYLARLSNTSGYVVYSNWIAATEWSVGQLSPGTYNWQVRARNQYGESPYSSEWTFIIQQGAPNAPSNLNASAVSQSQINLTWADNSSNETGFRLFREGLHVATLGAGTTTYQDTGLECGRGYNYYIVAYNDAGESGHSNTASATTQACPPTAPPAPNPVSPAQDTTFNCGDEITLVWDDLGAGVEYYAETWGANTRNSGWQTGNSWYLGEQDDYQTSWHVKARYVGETEESGWGSTTWFNANSCPQYPDLRPYTPSGYQYPVVPSVVQGTHSESTLYTGQATYFDWHFINDGNATAMDDFHVELWVDSDRVLRYPYSEVGTGWLQGFDDWAHTVSTPGWHTVRLATDPDGTVSESDETNNEWTRDFYWHVPCNDLNESNNDPASATWLAYRDTATGDICPVGEYDYYYLYGSAGDTIIADIDAQVIGSELDSVLTLFDTDGTTVLVENDDYDGLDSRIMYTLSHDGYHFLRVREYGDNDGGGDHFYQLSLSGGVTAPYYDDLEGSLFNWSFHGMWHQVDENSPYPGAHSGTHSMWYGQDTTGDYDDGTANNDSLIAPGIYIPDTGYYLRFNYWYETEAQGLDYDHRCVQVSVDDGPYYALHCLSDDGMGYWHHSPAIDLSDFVGHIIRIRFHFNTVDEYYNNFRGWYIDDFDISNTAPPSCSDGNEPNNSYATATTITYGGTESGYICPGGDLDYFAFTGNAGDTIIADVNADIYGSWLDSVLVLLASDGVTELASNDDAEPGSLDSLLGYTLPGDGTYYLKVRDYNHPSYGGSDYYYDLSLSVDNSAPTGAFLAPTTSTYISSTGHISIIAEASDVGSGVRNVTFLWHSGDWSDPNWEVLGEDWDGSDGWAIEWDAGSLPDQRDAALYAWAFDWAGNWVGMECWDLTLDREPPTTEMGEYAPYGGANFLDFWLDWYGDDPTAGVASYDIQYRDGLTGTWMDLVTDTADTYAHLVGADGHTYYFRSRARDWAGNAGEYPGTAQISYTVQVCPVDMDAWEIDDTVAESNPISTDGTAQTHNFDIAGDQDWVEFDAVEGQQYTFQTENVGGYADTVLHVYDTDGSTILDFNDDFEGLGWASRVDWTAPADGTYYVMVKHWDEHAYGCETVYTLSSGVHPIIEEYKVFLPLALRNR